MDDKIELKTADLAGPALDWAVAHATKAWEWAHEWFPTMTLDPTFRGVSDNAPGGRISLVPRNPMRQDSQPFTPSTDWAQGGRLIETHAITLAPYSMGLNGRPHYWVAEPWGDCPLPIDGVTPLIAACRAIVAANLGDVVQIPVELAKPTESGASE